MALSWSDHENRLAPTPRAAVRLVQPTRGLEVARARPPEPGSWWAYLLALAVPVAFCGGLLQLALLPALGVTVPRWLILAYGVGCILLALLAILLSPPRPARAG